MKKLMVFIILATCTYYLTFKYMWINEIDLNNKNA